MPAELSDFSQDPALLELLLLISTAALWRSDLLFPFYRQLDEGLEREGVPFFQVLGQDTHNHD